MACGTEDVLTCHVIIMREPRTGVTAIAHFDEFSRHWDFSGMMEDFLAKVGQLQTREEWEYVESESDGDWEWWDESEETEELQSQDQPNSFSQPRDPGEVTVLSASEVCTEIEFLNNSAILQLMCGWKLLAKSINDNVLKLGNSTASAVQWSAGWTGDGEHFFNELYHFQRRFMSCIYSEATQMTPREATNLPRGSCSIFTTSRSVSTSSLAVSDLRIHGNVLLKISLASQHSIFQSLIGG